MSGMGESHSRSQYRRVRVGKGQRRVSGGGGGGGGGGGRGGGDALKRTSDHRRKGKRDT